MQQSEKYQLTYLSKIDKFNSTYKKLILNQELSENEKTYLLTIAILSMKVYENDRRNKSYLEFGYYIILKYSIRYGDYKPVYDFSSNFGFYPIAEDILRLELIELNIKDVLFQIELEKFRYNSYIETIHQKNLRNSFRDDEREVAIIAPTSFGKSELIIESIMKNSGENKIAIIVPTKSLLVQTYSLVKKNFNNIKIIYHDEMYNIEDRRFIAVLTQERALRLLENEDLFFDSLYIDEAHNLLEKDNRNILLSRVIRINKRRNPNGRIYYFSPLIDNSNKLRVDSKQTIYEKRIEFNLKQPEYYLCSGNQIEVYNRYSNKFYFYNEFQGDFIDYILKHAQKKNFIYVRTPKSIENLVRDLYDRLDDIELDSDLDKLIKDLKSSVHENYWMIKLIYKGILYIHGKMPDILKEYLEYKFKKNGELKYIIANNVILEGVNLPIDSLFILTVRSLSEKEAINLIGRVNRLNNIFNQETNSLEKLLPKIHFVENPYNSSDLKSYIQRLRSNIFEEKVKNPTLIDYEIPKEINENDENIIYIENFILEEYDEEKDKIAKILYKNGIHNYINYDERYIEVIINKLELFELNGKDMIDIIYELFLDNILEIKHDLIYYLKTYENIRNYYKNFMNDSNVYSLKEFVAKRYVYYKRRIDRKNSIIYIGHSFGEIDKDGIINENSRYNKFIDLKYKNNEELVNIILIKFKLDMDFISYDLNCFVNTLYDLGVLGDKEFNVFTYGTENIKLIELQRLGLSKSLINKLNDDDMLEYIIFNEYNKLEIDDKFHKYYEDLSDIEKFELDKFL